MFDPVTATTEKVASPTIFTCGSPYTLAYFSPVRRVVSFFVTFENFGLVNRITGPGRKLFISAGLLMAYQAVDFCLISEVEILILPSVTCVARCATSLVALDIDSEVVDG